MTAYFERIFFQNPWVDADLPSLVYEDETGRVGGFVGVVPRRMLFRGEPIRVAVTTQLMVAPRYGGQVGRRLMSRLLAGPQELSITDDANDAARRLWESLGGECSPIYGLRWTRPLRPCCYAGRRLARRAFGRGVAFAARPPFGAAGALAGRVEPWLVDALGGANWAILRWLHQWTLLHSPRPEILHAIERGDALLSHLDGEWWLSF